MAKKIKDLPVGSLICDPLSTYNNQPLIWRVLEHDHTGDPVDSTTVWLLNDEVFGYMPYDAEESVWLEGNPEWRTSNIRQWLNSENVNWYSAQHELDTPPSTDHLSGVAYNYPYNNKAGFLTNLSADFKQLIKPATKITTVNEAATNNTYTTVDKMFILSTSELGENSSQTTNYNEGGKYLAFEQSGTNRRSSSWAWVRTHYNYSGGLRAQVYTYYGQTTKFVRGEAYCGRDANMVKPACCIDSEAWVSDQPNLTFVDGNDTLDVYTVLFVHPPEITTTQDNLGDKNDTFSFTFSIHDQDGGSCSANVVFNNQEIMTISNVVDSQAYTCEVTKAMLRGLLAGTHDIIITATNSSSIQRTKTITFNKIASQVAISGTDDSLGTVWVEPVYTYTVNDSDDNQVTVDEYINGVKTNTISNAQLQQEITFDFGELFDNLSSDTLHTISIVATNTDNVSVTRTITFTKISSGICFITDPITTDAPANKIIVNIDYVKDGNPTIMVEVTNNANATEPVWEDMTEEFTQKQAYEFINNPNNNYGVAVKVTISKNQTANRLYCNGIGFTFD